MQRGRLAGAAATGLLQLARKLPPVYFVSSEGRDGDQFFGAIVRQDTSRNELSAILYATQSGAARYGDLVFNTPMKSVQARFDRSWETRKESHYNHWVRGLPRNQIQLAFRRHWLTFRRYLADCPGDEVLEVGCGRGTIASYFADAGYSVTLLDSSPAILSIAQKIYRTNEHAARFAAGDAFSLPFGDNRFSISVSIGLLEHFDEIGLLMCEQLRVLRPGGVMLGYIVPERPDSVQRHFNWLNNLLSFCSGLGRSLNRNSAQNEGKDPLYRNGLTAEAYISALRELDVIEIHTHGMYPLPMISHSPAFPFSLLPTPLERLLVVLFSGILAFRRLILRDDPWICGEETGQAFLVIARKPAP